MKYGKGKVDLDGCGRAGRPRRQAYPVAQHVLDYRQLTKLKGTYIDALPLLIQSLKPDASIRPSIRPAPPPAGCHLPIRTCRTFPSAPKKVAKFAPLLFRSRAGTCWWRIIRKSSCACWHTCPRDPVLTASFRNGEDIHTRTAAEVFKVDPLMVTPDMRRSAKAVNFGIVYGQTPFGLAQHFASIAKKPNCTSAAISSVMPAFASSSTGQLPKFAQTGVAKTLLGRRRPIPDMQSRNPAARSFAERTAVNTPLQGTAADLIKLAMIRMARPLGRRENAIAHAAPGARRARLRNAALRRRDELRDLVKKEMESVYRTLGSVVGRYWLRTELERREMTAALYDTRLCCLCSACWLAFRAGADLQERQDGSRSTTIQGSDADNEGRCRCPRASRLVAHRCGSLSTNWCRCTFSITTLSFGRLPGFVVQWGINGDPHINKRWSVITVKDDPPKVPNKVGTVVFAKTGEPDSRSTQLFINLRDNTSPSIRRDSRHSAKSSREWITS